MPFQIGWGLTAAIVPGTYCAQQTHVYHSVRFSIPPSEWNKPHGGQQMMYRRGWKLTTKLSKQSASGLSGWGPVDPPSSVIEECGNKLCAVGIVFPLNVEPEWLKMCICTVKLGSSCVGYYDDSLFLGLHIHFAHSFLQQCVKRWEREQLKVSVLIFIAERLWWSDIQISWLGLKTRHERSCKVWFKPLIYITVKINPPFSKRKRI